MAEDETRGTAAWLHAFVFLQCGTTAAILNHPRGPLPVLPRTLPVWNFHRLVLLSGTGLRTPHFVLPGFRCCFSSSLVPSWPSAAPATTDTVGNISVGPGTACSRRC